MTLQSYAYLLFALVLWVAVYPVRQPSRRQLALLVASYLFYATWGLEFLSILIASSLLNYAWGIFLRRRPTLGRLWGGVALNITLLAIFKYLPSFDYLLPFSWAGGSLTHSLVMPVGISFWTFEALSYQFDLYREEELDPSLTEFCLYMALWPTVLSGPVCRLPDMLPQFRKNSPPDWEDVATGIHRIILGLFMKLVLAQLLIVGFDASWKVGIDYGFDQISRGWSGIDVWYLAIGYGFYLFFDFAGYSHIAIGSARLFGLRLSENFDRPYLLEHPLDLLDPLAYVAVVLDTRLRVPITGNPSPRPVVAKPFFSPFHDDIRALACGNRYIHRMGSVSRAATRSA